MLQTLKSTKGFTLIELLIVIVIIGILAGIVIGLTGTSARNKANDATAKSDMHELQNALEQYFIDNDAYPAAATWQADLVTAGLLTAAKNDPQGSAYAITQADTSEYSLAYTLQNTNDTGPNITGGVYTLTNKQ